MTRTKATWTHPKRVKPQTGVWIYNRASDCFTIMLDSTDPITGQQRIFNVWDDKPEWGQWRRTK